MKKQPYVKFTGEMVNGIQIVYSPPNQAWFVMWFDQILSIHNIKADAQAEATRLIK